MLLSGCGQLTGPKQAIKMGDYVIEEVVSTRCLGVQIDNALKWDHHVSELAKSFTQKLNLLKSLSIFCLDRRELISILGLFCPLLRMVCWFGALVVKRFSQTWNPYMSEWQK